MRQRPPTFELVGMPGSGKSTIYPLVRAQFKEDGLDIVEPVELSRGEAEVFFKTNNPVFWSRSTRFLTMVVEVRHAAGHGTREKLTRIVNGLWFGRAYAARVAHERAEVVLFEESTVHEMWRLTHMLRGVAKSSTLVRELWKPLRKSSTVIWLDASPGTRMRRMQGKRTLGPINRELAAEPATGPLWRETEAVYDRLVRRAVRRSGRLIVIDNDADTSQDTSVRAIAELIADAATRRHGRSDRARA